MSINEEELAKLLSFYPKATVSHEAGSSYIFFPEITAVFAGEKRSMRALLCPMKHGGYSTRLFLPEAVHAKGTQNWTQHFILGQQWHTASFNGVPETLPLIEILMAHLRHLK